MPHSGQSAEFASIASPRWYRYYQNVGELGHATVVAHRACVAARRLLCRPAAAVGLM